VGGEIGIYLGIKYALAIHYVSISFFSSYFLIRGLSIWFGGFISEADTVVGLFTVNDTPPMTMIHSFYSIMILLLWIGMAYSYFKKSNASDSKDAD
jgi:hypothetical protein